MKYLKFLFSPVFMGFLFVAFALSMAVATFIENDFGSPVAYSMVYNTIWFELILLLLATNLIGQLIIYKLFRKSQTADCTVSSFIFIADYWEQELQGISDGKVQCTYGKGRSRQSVSQLKNISAIQLKKLMELFHQSFRINTHLLLFQPMSIIR